MVIDKWIPVSEELPKTNKQVLITAKDKEDGELFVGTSSYGYYHNRMGNSRCNKIWKEPFPCFSVNYGIIAWMPFPMPYQYGDSP